MSRLQFSSIPRNSGWMRRGLCGCACVIAATSIALGQPRLLLDEALTTAFARNPAIVASRSEYEAALGDATAARQPFDLAWRPFVSTTSERVLSGLTQDGLESGPLRRDVASGFSMQRMLRSGMTVDSTIAGGRSAATAPAVGHVSHVTADVRALVPLLYGRHGGLERVNEQVTRRIADSRAHDMRHAYAELSLSVAFAYWAYAAATERVAVLEFSEQRAALLVEEIAVLVKADERPASDADALRASLASRQAQNAVGQQQRLDAQYALGTVMGLSAQEIAALGAPATDLPSGQPDADAPNTSPSALAAGATDRRSDLTAARERIGAIDRQLTGIYDALRPRLDVIFDVGYRGSTFGRDIPGDFRGWRAGMTVQYEPRSSQSQRRGLAMRTGAILRQETAEAAALVRAIEGRAALAAAAVARHAGEVERAREAVRWSKAAVETEKKRLQLGMSTVFSTIQAEDSLTSALLREIDARHRYAVAIAELQFAAGQILEPSMSRDGVQVNVRGLLAAMPAGRSQ